MAPREDDNPEELPHSHPADPIHEQGASVEPWPASAGLVTNAGVLIFRVARGWLKGSPLGLARDGALAAWAQVTTALLRAMGSRPDHESIVRRGAELGSATARTPPEEHAADRAVAGCRHRGD
jgi:hypothetical protein